jgi:hypothetical protein
VRGFIYLNVATPVNAEGVALKVKGFEKVHWREKRSRTKTVQNADGTTQTEIEYYYVDHDGDKSFFRCKVSIAKFSGKIAPGQYAFAFSFFLPRDLPGSFSDSGPEHSAKVRSLYCALNDPDCLQM